MSHDSLVDRLIDLAIEEDLSTGDLSTDAIIPVQARAVAEMTAKADGVLSGMEIARRVFARFEEGICWQPLAADGDAVRKGEVILRLEAGYRALLRGERVALNFLQRMSGIATRTALYARELAGTNTRLLDTRKTAPGLRVLDKMAVVHGGGHNHRMGLYDMIMLKDNHVKIAGGIPAAVRQARAGLPLSVKIEVETSTLEEVLQAVGERVDIIMLDNMTTAEMARAVRLVDGRARVEASGNMTLERLREVAATGVDYISVGALTHSVTALDISMNVREGSITVN
ncbi:MAG: carboxylating nicotinate-nucleotide diphosphorylase [Odoribacteraceae bacterium]|jgi:nicotinate-nucleotide pyrophosphorylase (carboxylating)|nr:carboxylating nicotinate-nucleotide diphosphorylase [Odoribacteraceae bacterium]